jgi:uncharacterized protein (TIGR02569 family)
MQERIEKIAHLFKADTQPVLLQGGRGQTYRVGNIVIKPTINHFETEEMAHILFQLPHSNEVRFPKPVQSIQGNWVEDGFEAWSWLEGKEEDGRYADKIKICDAFSKLFVGVNKPKFIDAKTDSWAMADRVGWDEITAEYEPEFQKMIDVIRSKLKPVTLEQQIIHGDIVGNIIFNEKEGPAVIDVTLYWRPADYAKALLVLEAICWENADVSTYQLIKDVEHLEYLMYRAALVKIAEQPEHIKYFGKDKDLAMKTASRYIEVLKQLGLL